MLIVAGDMSQKDEFTKIIESFKLPEGPESSFPEFKLKSHTTVDIHQKEVGMATLNMVIQAPLYSSHEGASEDLALNCLGFGESSRLYSALVLDKSLANVASASTMFMAKGGSHFLRLVFPHKNMKEVFAKFTEVLNTAIAKGFSADEIAKIKNQYLSSKIYERESIESFAFSLGHSFAQSGDIRSEEEFIERIKGTTPHAVNKSIKDVFARNVHFALQIPKDASLAESKKYWLLFIKTLKQ